jgi:hypothetical protein
MQEQSNPTTFTWQRTLKRMDFFPVQRIAYETTPKFPHDSRAHDRELLEVHYGCPVAALTDWHWCGRAFVMADGTRGRLDAR